MESKDWHEAFYAALRLVLSTERQEFTYDTEHRLNQRPLKIDLVLLKTGKKYGINNPIGKIFRRYNLFEYKSPRDKLDVDVLFKVMAYGCLLKAYGKRVNEIKANEISISIYREVPPVKLFRQLKDIGFIVDNRYSGIYYIKGLTIFPLQIIVGRELPEDENIWLKHLKDRVDKEEAKRIFDIDSSIDIESLNAEDYKTVLTLYMNANRDVIAEMLKEGGEGMQTIEEILGIPERIDKIIAEKDHVIAEKDRNIAEKDKILSEMKKLVDKLMAENAALKAAQ